MDSLISNVYGLYHTRGKKRRKGRQTDKRDSRREKGSKKSWFVVKSRFWKVYQIGLWKAFMIDGKIKITLRILLLFQTEIYRKGRIVQEERTISATGENQGCLNFKVSYLNNLAAFNITLRKCRARNCARKIWMQLTFTGLELYTSNANIYTGHFTYMVIIPKVGITCSLILFSWI